MKVAYALIATLILSAAACGQTKPPPAEGAPPPPGERPDGPPPGERPEGRERGPGGSGGGFPGGRGGPGMRGPGGPGGGRPMDLADGQDDPRLRRFELMRGYLDAVDRYARLAHDPQMSGIAAVVTANDILKPRGADVAIDYFSKLLPEVKSPAVGRAIRIQLVDLYKAAGKQDLAMEQLKQLILATPEATEAKKQ